MSTVLLSVMIVVAAAPSAAGGSGAGGAPRAIAAGCPAAVPAPGPGVLDPFHLPGTAAAQLNADGKLLYRQERWEQARQKYRAAEALDPQFLAPALNVACSFVRQERYGDALAEVLRLIDRAYLPWSHEVLAAADLGALKVRAEGIRMKAAMDAARLRWADGLMEDVILVARLRRPLKLPDEQEIATPAGRAPAGVAPRALVLGQRQEVFAWSPRTHRYRQLTSEDGRVLAVARSADRRRIAFITAEKLIRGQTDSHGARPPVPGSSDRPVSLRGVAIHEVDLRSLARVGDAAVPGDVQVVDIVSVGSGFVYRIAGAPPSATAAPPRAATFVLADERLQPRSAIAAADPMRPTVTLTGQGVRPHGGPVALGGGCAGTVRDQAPGRGPPTIIVTANGRRAPGTPTAATTLTIGGPHGAGLTGLSIP